MKVAIGYRVVEGPWGGGNGFVTALESALRAAHHEVVHELRDTDIDIILLFDPRARLPNIPFAAGTILRYLAFRNPEAIVAHRVNECDERKNTRTMNLRLRLANYCADHTVFVGSWLQGLPVWRDRRGRDDSVILNGADDSLFHSDGHRNWDQHRVLKLVTHHWGGNWMKGFDVYDRIDSMLETASWRDRIAFTYIGNLPKGYRFRNVRYVLPLAGKKLADELRSHHVYVTASINEPGGNHQNEGALCGLPLLYRKSGCLPEYCGGFGIMFEGPEDFETALGKIIESYASLAPRMRAYPHTAAKTMAQYLALFEDLTARRADITRNRRLLRDPLRFFLNQIPW
jgi:hypothetical protein